MKIFVKTKKKKTESKKVFTKTENPRRGNGKIISKIINMRSDVKNAKTEKEKPEKFPVWHETDWDYFKQQQFSCPSEKKFCGGMEGKKQEEGEFCLQFVQTWKAFFSSLWCVYLSEICEKCLKKI